MSRPSALLAALALLVSTRAFAAPRYHLVDLGFVTGGTASEPNHFGPGNVVLGRTDMPGTFGGHATRWNLSPAGTLLGATDLLGLDGSIGSSAYAMNASGWIVGYSSTANPQPRPVLWRDGAVIDIDGGADHNANVYAFDVNDAGVVCGMITKSGGGGGWDGAVWVERASQPGRFDRTFLPMHPSGNPVLGWTEAQSIDASGRVFGRTNLGGTGDRATLWLADAARTPVLLEPLPTSAQSMPGDINDLGDAVGYTIMPDGNYLPTRWARDTTHAASVLTLWPDHDTGRAMVVSSAGDVVLGLSQQVDHVPFPPVLLQSRVVMWDAAGLWDLGQQLDASGLGWTLVEPRDMNANGWIAAVASFGGVQHAVVLLPVSTGIAGVPGATPAGGLALASPSPNPARGDVRLAFTLARAGDVRLDVLDAQGRRVARVAEGAMSAGSHAVTWSGLDASGALAGPGLYFAALQTGEGRVTTRIVRVR